MDEELKPNLIEKDKNEIVQDKQNQEPLPKESIQESIFDKSIQDESSHDDAQESIQDESSHDDAQESIQDEPSHEDIQEPIQDEPSYDDAQEPVQDEPSYDDVQEPVQDEPSHEDIQEPVQDEQIDKEQNPIIHEYGRTLSGSQVIEEAKNGNVPEEDVILITNKHSLPITDPNLAVEPEEVIDFYDAERLEHMNEEKTLTPEFVNIYNENLVSTLPDDRKEKLYNSIVEESKKVCEEKKEPYDQLIFDYYMAGILPAGFTGSSFDFNFIKNKFEKGAISYNTLVDLYTNDIITSKQFLKLLELKQIDTKELFTGDVLTEQELKIISSDKKAEIFSEAIEEKKLSLDELMDLYLYEDAIRVYDLRKALIKGKIYDSLTPYLSTNTEKSKIEELYVNYLIDYNTLVALKREHIISEDEFDTMKTKIDSKQFYEDLENTKDLYIHTTPDDISGAISHFYRAGTEEKQDFKQEQQMLNELYGVDKAYEEYTTIHATDLDGNPTSLDGYTCLPMPRFEVVTLKKFHTDNDTFIMPYQQAAYFLHNSYKPTEYYEGSQSELDITNRPEDETGYEAEIALPFEDYNDTDAITVVQSGLNYARQLFDGIYELAGNDDEREILKQQGRPTPLAEKYLQTSNIDYNQEREDLQ